MRRSFSLATLLFLAMFGPLRQTNAQDNTSKIDVYGGYDYVRFNVNSNVGGVPPTQTFNANGGGSQLQYNANGWFGVVADLDGYYVSTPPRAGAFSYLFGPRVNSRRDKIKPFAQAIFGGPLATGGIGEAGAENHFAMAVGGGIDFKVSEHFSVRPVQVDYFMTKFPDGLNNRQNNFRFGTGIVFRFGRG